MFKLVPRLLIRTGRRHFANERMSPSATTARLDNLRKLMKERNLEAYFVPSEDAHQSEYIADWDGRRAFISGFTGSAGFALVAREKAALWTDGRYFLQAENQLDSNWILMKAGLPETPSKEDFLGNILPKNGIVGVDAKVISYEAAAKLKEALGKKGLALSLMNENLIDKIWNDRPPISLQPVFHLTLNYCGRESKDKIAAVRKYLTDNKFTAFAVTALDEVAWLFNLRGSDISCNPNFFSYAIVGLQDVFLYMDESKLTSDARSKLEGVQVKQYHQIFDDLVKMRSTLDSNGEKLLISRSCNAALVEAVGSGNITVKPSPIEMEKAIKNNTEIEGMINCHLRDAVALVKYFSWLEQELKAGKVLDEVDGGDKLLEFRQQGKDFKGMSFDTISGSGPNGAIIHYKPEKPSAANINMEQMYLCDSGGQYLDGTTDVTRTLHFGTPTKQEKECFTRVLQGHVALDRAVFPTGTTGFMLDCLARLPLWEAGLDYRHGTGHGVGHFLNVHEGPQSISFRLSSNEVPFKAGMTITNEPGFYLDGHFGIRIENILIVREAGTENNFGGTSFLKFENITMVPIQTKLMETSLMSEKEICWVNEHHVKCWERVSPLLKNDLVALEWLRRETLPIKK